MLDVSLATDCPFASDAEELSHHRSQVVDLVLAFGCVSGRDREFSFLQRPERSESGDLAADLQAPVDELGGISGSWFDAGRQAAEDEQAVEQTGLDGLTFHGLRHSAATQWVANGIDARTVQYRLGHADPRLVLRLYAHASTPADRRAAEVSSTVFWDEDRRPDVP